MLGGWESNYWPGGKVMAAYRRDYGFSHLWADCLGADCHAHIEHKPTFTVTFT